MDTGHYDNDDEDPSMNGWIKKEIEDDDEFEHYLKPDVADIQSGDRYEELMNLTKDDLVGKIFQLEEDVRYLQDIRQGLEKNIENLHTSVSKLEKLVSDLFRFSAVYKEAQPVVSSPPPAQSARATTLPRSSTSSAQASPRSTPIPFPASSASQRSNSGMMNKPASNVRPSSSVTSTQQPAQIASSIVTTDRMHSGGGGGGSGGKTVTITRSTNVVIKTEIPSPPPDHPMITQQALPAPVAQRSKPDVQRQYQTRQQQMPRGSVAAPSSSQMPFSQSQAYARTGNQGGNMNVQQVRQPQQRGRPSSHQTQFQNAPSTRSVNQMQRNQQMSNAFQRQQQQHRGMQAASVPQPSATYTPVSGAKVQNVRSDIQFPSPVSRSTASVSNVSSGGASRQRVNQAPMQASCAPASKNTASEMPESAPMKMPSGITLPFGLTLSIVTTPTSDQKPQQPGGDKPVISSTATKMASENVSGAEDGASKNSDKNITSSNTTNTSSAVSTTSAAQATAAEEEEEEDGEFYDEVAVLEPDKSSSPSAMDVSVGQGSDGQVTSGSEGFARSVDQSPESYWNAQNAGARGDQKNTFQNNDEYMYEETDDIDSGDEHDSKIYLSEDVSLSKELVDSCIKQGPTPAKLTRNLMQALFPDLREIASGCNDGADSSGPSLPSNKLNAIISHVQKVFPQTKRSQIVLTMNMKCREARTQLTKNRRTHVQYSPYIVN